MESSVKLVTKAASFTPFLKVFLRTHFQSKPKDTIVNINNKPKHKTQIIHWAWLAWLLC